MEPINAEKFQQAKDELFRALQFKNSLRYYLEVAHHATQLQFSLCDTSFCVLAAYPPLDDEQNIVTANGRHYVRFAQTVQMEEQRHIKRLIENKKPSVAHDPRFPNPIMFQAIRINHAVVAYLFSPGRPEGFQPEELQLVEYLSQILSIEMQKSENFASESSLKYEFFLTELLEGRLKSDRFAAQRLRQLKRRERPYYYLAEFSFDDNASKHPSAAYYFEQILSIFPESLVGRVKGRIFMLLPRETMAALTDWEGKTLQQFLDFNRMHIGFSYRFTSLVQAYLAPDQTRAALSEPTPEQRICYYEQYSLAHLFSLVQDGDRLRTFVHPDILELRHHDELHHTQYAATLDAFILSGRNAARAAEMLYIHKSTFFFRMNKIAELLGEDVIHNSDRLFDYELSFCLLRCLDERSEEPDM